MNTEGIRVIRGNSRDIDSTNLKVYQNGQEIAYGHLNNRSNMAHITTEADDFDLEDYLTEAIEKRTINIE